MTAHSRHPLRQQLLRKYAEDRLREGRTLPTRGWVTSLDALSLLYKLASSPESAGDAIKLLHELQVHQVELDLQNEQLEASERGLTEDLIHSARLFESAPVSYFSVTPEGTINRANAAGAALCGEDRAALIGRRVDEFLAPESRPVLEKLAAKMSNGVLHESCEVRTRAGAAFLVKAGLVPGGLSILMVFLDLTDSLKPAGPA